MRTSLPLPASDCRADCNFSSSRATFAFALVSSDSIRWLRVLRSSGGSSSGGESPQREGLRAARDAPVAHLEEEEVEQQRADADAHDHRPLLAVGVRRRPADRRQPAVQRLDQRGGRRAVHDREHRRPVEVPLVPQLLEEAHRAAAARAGRRVYAAAAQETSAGRNSEPEPAPEQSRRSRVEGAESSSGGAESEEQCRLQPSGWHTGVCAFSQGPPARHGRGLRSASQIDQSNQLLFEF